MLRPALGLAALAVACVLVVRNWPGAPEDRGTLREASSRSTGTTVLVTSVRLLPDGGVTLTWRRHPGAEAYRVRFFSADLTDLATLDLAADTLLTLAPGDVPRPPDPTARVFAELEALMGGDPIARSTAVPLPSSQSMPPSSGR